MKLGISSYCLSKGFLAKELTVLEGIEWIAGQGGEHIEIVPAGFNLTEDPQLADAIRMKAKAAGIDVSNYLVTANFVTPDMDSYENEIERIKREVDIAARLGVKLMRHDVASRPPSENSNEQFIKDLPLLAEACARIADYAAAFGITTSVENHGYYVQASDRVQSLIQAVGRPNYRMTLDVGNFLCVDEDPVSAVKNTIGLAAMVHVKDFYYRPSHRNPGNGLPGWLRTSGGHYLRGSIVGQGDIDLREIIRIVKASGYDGYISIEFEGIEEYRSATQTGFEFARRIWDEV